MPANGKHPHKEGESFARLNRRAALRGISY